MTTIDKGVTITPERWKELRRRWDKDFHFNQAEAEELLAATKPKRVVPGMTQLLKQRNHLFDCFEEAMRELSKHDMGAHKRIFTKYKTGQ